VVSWTAPVRGRARRAWTTPLMAITVLCGIAALGAGCGADKAPPAIPAATTAAASPSTAASPSAAPANETLAGKWRDEKSNVYEFTATGAGSYTAQVIDRVGSICTPINIKVSPIGGRYEGTMAFYKVANSVCGDYLGDGTIIIELGAAGTTAQVRWAGPAAVGNCLNCTPHTWTRQS
jgi:hypothetical protein